jgi:hypothetical protein
MTERREIPDVGLGDPKMPFSETFSAETLVLERLEQRRPPAEFKEADRPSLYGKMLGEALALMAELGRHDAPMPIPEPCLTCAFRRGTLPNESAGTGILALNCVLRIDKHRFACHHGMKDGEPQRICFGYVAAMLAPFSKVSEILRAFNDQLARIGELGPDQVRAAFDKWLDDLDPERRMDVYEAAREYAKSQIAEMRRGVGEQVTEKKAP